MNQYYLELKTYLQEVEHHPEVVMDKSYTVFRSERSFYGADKKTITIASIQSQELFMRSFHKISRIQLVYIHY